MRSVLLILVIILTISGFWLSWILPVQGFSLPLLLHLLSGFLFIAVFPIYVWEHINKRKAFLKYWHISISGILELMAGSILIITGILLFLYESGQLPLTSELHFYWTWGLLISFVCHFIAVKKRNKK